MMAFLSFPLLGQQSRITDLGSHFRSTRSSLTLQELVGLIGGMVVIVLATWFLSKWSEARKNKVVNSNRLLFRDLCRLHNIDWPAKKLLSQLARARAVTHPVDLFLQSDFFEVADLPPALLARQNELQELRGRLFAELQHESPHTE